ncbi:YolD-like family protein [Salinicoccus carnicancri]|uniref:YolD-like family protein n=1 Tax=Salinicoccus carnicancri TaxID=558170 RepID=UPI0002E1AF31|nr:YolD-like family protein [Salinicoccus carnicancri]
MRVNEKLDYREMDPSELDSNIPRGRGMIKWQPFATMPEQYERVAEMIEENAKVPAPTHDNETLVRLEEELRRSVGETVVLRYWNDGYEVQLECRIEYIADRAGMVVVSKGREVIQVEFKNIYEIV